MGYFEEVRQPGESVKHYGELHWMIFRYAIMWGVIAAVVAVSPLLYPSINGGVASLVASISFWVCVMASISPIIERATTEIIVTDRRILHKVGLVRRKTKEMNMAKVETVEVEQTFLGRIFIYGTVVIIGTGATWEPLLFIAYPLKLRNAIIVE